MSRKTKTQTTQSQNYNNTNSYGWQVAPETADVQALRDFKFQADPSIGYAFGSAKSAIGNSFNNPLGGVYSPQLRDSILRSSLSDLAQKESQAKSEASQQLQGQQFGQRAAVASMTAPRLVQTGSSGSGTSQGQSVQSTPMWQDALMGGLTGAAS